MKRIWAAGLGLSLGWLSGGAVAGEVPTEFASTRDSAVTLGRPVPAGHSDPAILRASYLPSPIAEPNLVVRAKADGGPAGLLPEVLPSVRPEEKPPRRLVASNFGESGPAPRRMPLAGGERVAEPIPGPAPQSEKVLIGGETLSPCEPVGWVPGRFYGSAEYLWWAVKEANVPPLVTTGPATPFNQTPRPGLDGILGPGTTVLFGGGQLSENSRSGGRLSAGYWLDPCQTWAVEGSGFYLAEETQSFAFNSLNTATGVLARPFFRPNIGVDVSADGTVATPFGPGEFRELVGFPGLFNGTLTVDTKSKLWGAELNLRRNLRTGCTSRVDLLLGFRYLDLDEELAIDERIAFGDVGGVTNDVGLVSGPAGLPFAGGVALVQDRFRTRNQFFGPQIGAVAEFRRGRWSLDVRGKVALGSNHEIQDIAGNQKFTAAGGVMSTYQGGLLALSSNIGHFTRNHFAVVPELGLNLGYQLTDHLRAFVGYNFLYVSNVIRPGDQIDRTLDVTRIPNFGLAAVPLAGQPRPAVVFRETSFWAQGLTGGLELRY